MKRSFAIVLTVGLLLASAVSAQQKPAPPADKGAAEKALDDLARRNAEQAAQQAEAVARAQQKVAEEARRRDIELARQAEAKMNELIPIDVEVVISRYQGDKKISSLPYALAVNAGERADGTKLRMGANVPVPNAAFTPASGGSPNPLVSYNYQDIGTNIDCNARPLGDGRFVVSVRVSERSVVQAPATTPPTVNGAPVIRNFESSNNLVLRDGQTRQFTAAADRVTGEVVKVDVTLKVAK
jgi:hypothetical protein